MRRFAFVAALLLPSACFVPPAVMASGFREIDLPALPAAAEVVEIPVGADDRLRGVYVPAEPGAPLVVYLQPAGSSVTMGQANDLPSMATFMLHMSGLGYATLVVDYRGVGPSDGSRSPSHLAADARAIWEEALRRVDRNPQRIILRGTSLGTLAIASLLESGAQPAGVVMIAPVRGETAASHYAHHFYFAPLAWLASSLMRDVGETDIVATLERNRVPTLVIAAAADVFLPPNEQKLLREAIDRPDNEWVTARLPGVDDAFASHALIGLHSGLRPHPREIAFLRRLHGPTDVDRRAHEIADRIPAAARGSVDPQVLRQSALRVARRFPTGMEEVAAALAARLPDAQQVDAVAEWLFNLPLPRLDRLDYDTAADLLTAFEPPIDPDLVVKLSWVLGPVFRKRHPMDATKPIGLIVEPEQASDPSPSSPGSAYLHLIRRTSQRLRRELASMDPDDRKLVATRHILKAAGFPDRIEEIGGAHPARVLSAWDGRAWVIVDIALSVELAQRLRF